MFDKNITIPENFKPNNLPKLGDMEVGDSFAVVYRPYYNGLRVAISRLRKKYPERKFLNKIVVEDGEKVWRCWRTA